jgi:hypothetical protein
MLHLALVCCIWCLDVALGSCMRMSIVLPAPARDEHLSEVRRGIKDTSICRKKSKDSPSVCRKD